MSAHDLPRTLESGSTVTNRGLIEHRALVSFLRFTSPVASDEGKSDGVERHLGSILSVGRSALPVFSENKLAYDSLSRSSLDHYFVI